MTVAKLKEILVNMPDNAEVFAIEDVGDYSSGENFECIPIEAIIAGVVAEE